MEENYTMLDVEAITFDTENPRIKMALEKYGDQITAERIYFALRSAAEGTKSTSSFISLKDSILASDGVMVPITVIRKDGKYVCIDGNTRLAIYKQLGKEQEDGDGNWTKIKSVELIDANQRDIETVRVSAHLVGARDWPAYEKARYLHYLRNSKFMDYSEMIALCGGNKTEIERQIDAYHDMNEYYRDIVDDDTGFRIDRYSGFVELQKPKIKGAIFDAGLDLKDFGEWIRDGKIFRLETVRDLPKILRDDEAKRIFLDGGPRSIEEAAKLLDHRLMDATGKSDKEVTLEKASLYHLAEVLTHRINDIPHSEVRALRNGEYEDAEEQVGILENLSTCLQEMLQDVSE